MFDREFVPVGLGEMPPGAKLAACLASVDRSQLNGHDLVVVLQAEARLISHHQANLMATMVEISQCPPGDVDSPVERGTDPEAREFAADEIRAALLLTRRAADSDLGLARDLRERLRAVWEALHTGSIDVRRARTIANGVAHLPVDTARTVIEQIIGEAPFLTADQLAALDPPTLH